MRVVSFCLSACLLAAAVGCTARSNSGGGTERATKFDLAGPTSTTSVKQGETQTVTIKVERGKDFKQAVALKTEPPAGVLAELSSISNKASESADVNMKVTASDKAAVGDHVIYVVGTPETGTASKLDVKIKVVGRPETPKDNVTLSLHGPLLATTVKQGETKTIDINLKQSGGKYAGNVKLSVENPQKGISAEFTSNTIKPIESGTVGLKISADKTADLGEHTLRITGTPDSGTVTPAEVKVKVVAP